MVSITTVAAVALVGLVAPGTTNVPVWQTDYVGAMALAAKQGKPMAVFIARGANGYERVVGDGSIPPEAGQLLKNSYVCVYVNAETAAGGELAAKFALTEGLVISSAGGTHQALRHDGTVSRADLTAYLTKYADPSRPVTTTESRGRQVVVTTSVVQPAGYTLAAPASGVVVGTSPVQPVGYAYPVGQTYYPAAPSFPAYQPAFGFPGGFSSFGFSGGG